MKTKTLFLVILVLALILSGCKKGDGTTTAPTTVAPPGPTTRPTDTPVPPTDTPSGPAALSPDPQPVAFKASDGQELQGLYYPAAVNPAPVVVLMHWVGGDKSDWYEVAPWLQNRGLKNPFPDPGDLSWWDPTWFPAVPQGRSYGVFIFSFRGCQPMSEQGCASIEEGGWQLDAQAAMLTATTLNGVDPAKVVAIGASIGADGVVDGCAWLSTQKPGACKGALSLSPGSYLTQAYPDAVKTLGQAQPPLPAWCLADENEISVCNSAADAGNTKFKAVQIPGGQHGMMLLRKDLAPLPMQLILDFLSQTVGP